MNTADTMNAPAAISYLGEDTPAKVFRQRCRTWADQPALRYKQRGLWQSTTWAEYFARVRATGLAMQALGLERGQVVCVLAENRPEWLYVDMGAQCMGLVGNGVDPTSAEGQLQYILRHIN
jgi:long-chain acyl-CoA synthetase